MWLPKDERRLLQGYYANIGQYDRDKCFHNSAWGPVINSIFIKYNANRVKTCGEDAQVAQVGTNNAALIKKMAQILKDEKVITETNKILEARGLIRLRGDQTTNSIIGIMLTLNGYDLGRKYNSWFTRTGLLFAEYKHHWFWLIVSFLGGIIGTLIVNWLSK
jgi:hypothetical protein